MRAVVKILSIGASVVVGVLVNEAISKTPIGAIPIAGDIIQTFCGTLVTGIMSCTLLYFLDRNEKIKQQSTDGTRKFLFELADGLLIETVLMPQEYGLSICVTTQVGCRIGCTFCASTLGGLKRNLEAGEIVSQVLKVQQELDKKGLKFALSNVLESKNKENKILKDLQQ